MTRGRIARLSALGALVVAGCTSTRAAPGPHGPRPGGSAVDADRVPFGPDERAQELAFLREVLRESYSHLETKRAQWGADLEQLARQYEPLIRRADTWDRYERVMVGFVSEFHDAHLAWRRRRGPREKRRRLVRLGLSTRFVEGALVVDEVWAGSGAEKAGLHVGDRIVGIDGETVEERMGALAALRSWSRLEDARYDFAEQWPAARVDLDAAPPERRVTRERADGAYETLWVRPETAPRPGPAPPDLALEKRGGAALLSVRSLGGRAAELEARLAEMGREIFTNPSGLVVDLRGNAGGFDRAARLVAAPLCSGSVTGAQVRVRLSPRARAARPEWKELSEDPARPGWSVPQPVRAECQAPRPYPGRMAVLIDAGCRSSCEALALLLRAMGARLLGERTGGSSGAPLPVLLPRSGSRVTVPAWAMFDLDGRPIEGIGVAPDEEIIPTRAEVTARRDRALERALAYTTGG